MTKPSGVPDRLRRHADPLLVAGIVLVALGLRLAFAFRAPPLLEFRDSASYALPALDLLRGAGFDLELKRPPAYPLFLALGFRLVGEDLPAVLVLQHLLGAAVAAMTYALVRPVAGRALGALAGLMVALNGGLIFLEHSVLAEPLFTFLLVAAVLVGTGVRLDRPDTAGARRAPLRAVVAGILLGLATLTRPGALMLALPLALALAWLASGSARWRLAVGGLVLLGCVGTVLPWMVRNQAVHGTFAVAGGLGEALIYRTRHSDRGFSYREPPAAELDAGEARIARARRWVYRQLARTDQADVIFANLQREFGLSQAEADRLLREIALRGISQDPGRYLLTTAEMTTRLAFGWDKELRSMWDRTGKRRFQEEWGERGGHLLQGPTAVHEQEYATAEALLDLYDHYRASVLLVPLFLVGAAASLLSSRFRPALPATLAAAGIVVLNVAASGPISRHLVSVEPLIAVAAMAGLAALWELMRTVLRARPSWRPAPRRAPAHR